jgi:hypothetical protein
MTNLSKEVADSTAPTQSTLVNPRVSIIVRSMARASPAPALDSIALQDYPAIEVVVVGMCGPTHPSGAERLDAKLARHQLEAC